MAFLDDVQVGGSAPAPSPTAKLPATSSFLSDVSVGKATAAAPKVSAPVSAPSPSIPLSTPAPTQSMFSKFLGFASNAVGSASTAISKATSAPTSNTLGTNATANTLKYLPSELARAIPGVSELQDNPEVTQFMDAQDLPKNVGSALGDTAAGLIKAPVTALADVWDAGRQVIGKNPNASFNIPVLGKVTSNQFNVAERIKNGEDPLAATLAEGGAAIFNTLFFADVLNRVAGVRAVKTAETTGNISDTGLTPEAGPKSGRLYEAPTSYSKGGAQVLPQAVLDKMKAQGVALGPDFDPKMPTFFRVVKNGSKYTGEVMQLRPSYLQSAYEKVFGTKTPTASVPELLGGVSADMPPQQLSKIASDAKATDVTTLHSETIDPADIKDAVNTQLSKTLTPSTPEIPEAPSTAPVLGASMAQTVTHNVLRLGNGDTGKAAEGAKVLQSEIKTHVADHGEQATHQALQERLGVDEATATRLVNETKPAPTLAAPESPSTFLTDTEVAHGAAEGVDLKQPTKLSNEVAAPLAEKAADTHWRDVQEPAIKAGKPIVIGADDLKDHFGKDYNDNNHPVYSRAAFLEYEHALKVSPVKEVVFTGGGPASGKTEIITKNLIARGFKGIVYDSNMANLEGVKKQIAMARAAGFKVVIKGVLPNLEKARTFSIQRANKIGRHISDTTFARGHAGFPKVAQNLLEDGLVAEDAMHIFDTRDVKTMQEAVAKAVHDDYIKDPLAILRKLDYNEEDFKTLYGKDQFDATTGQRLNADSVREGLGTSPGESGANSGEGDGRGDRSGVLETKESELDWEENYVPKIEDLDAQARELQAQLKTAKAADKPALLAKLSDLYLKAASLEDGYLLKWGPSPNAVRTIAQPMRGFIAPGQIIDDIQTAAEDVAAYIEQDQHTTELTGTVTDAIYQHEGVRKAMRQRAIQLLQSRGNDLTAEGWEHLYHYDENSDESLTKEEMRIYKEIIGPLKKALTESRTEYRNLGGIITTDLQEEVTPRYAKEKGGPIDKLIEQTKEVVKGAKTLYNGGLLAKSVGSGAKHRVFHIAIDTEGNRHVISIKAKRVTAFKKGVLTDLGEYNATSKNSIVQKEIVPLRKEVARLAKEINTLESVNVGKTGIETKLKNLESKAFDAAVNMMNVAEDSAKGQSEKDNKKLKALIHDIKLLQKVKPADDIVLRKERIETLQKKIYDASKEIFELEMKHTPTELHDRVFVDKEGKTYDIGQARTKEIEANTQTRYHKNALANYTLAYDRTQNALSALKLLNRIEKTPEFADLIVKENPEEAPPAKWKDLSGVLPQFRGYYAEPKMWEALKDLSSRLQGREPFPVVDEVNNFLTSMIVLNPIMHFPNVAMGWAGAESGTGTLPGLTAGSRANFARAVNEVKNKGPLYLSYLEHGAPFMAIKGTASEFTKAVLEQYTEEVQEAPKEHEALAKALGYANPAAWMKGLNKLNEDITWGGNDIMFMHAILDWADKNGGTPEDAIKEISKRMADYRLPSRIGPGALGRALSLTLQSRAFLFSRFHYSGVIKPWIEGVKDTAGPRSTGKQRLSGVRTLAYLGLMALLVYPFVNKLLQGVTGDKKTYISMAGPTKIVQNVEKLSQAGVEGIPAFGQSLLTLSPATTAIIELGMNIDLYTRNPIYGNPPAQGMSAFGLSMIAPLSSGSRMTAGDFALSLLGIYTPKNTTAKNALHAQKYDELPALQQQVKKLIVEGNQAKANALMKDFNDRAIANYNTNALATGAKPLAADGSENEAFLKEWGIAQPGVKALDNAATLYGDGSLTSKSSLLDNVSLYAKAVGTDPATAFERIFTGQRIIRVGSGPDASIIVERMPLMASEKVKRDRGAVQGQVLDHVIPLEAGGSNDRNNLNLIPAANNVGEQHTFENMLGDAVKKGVISQAQVREYSIRYKAGQGETLPQGYMDEFKNKYGSKPLTIDEAHQLILDNEPK